MALTEGKHSGEFILSEANYDRSREEVTIVSGQDLTACKVLGKITSAATLQCGDSLKAQQASQTLAQLQNRILGLPLKLQ